MKRPERDTMQQLRCEETPQEDKRLTAEDFNRQNNRQRPQKVSKTIRNHHKETQGDEGKPQRNGK